ncbi:hypothetical protein N7466_007892 [Penicillium verhagenii]|uniref:uncharacterized protein n=1 Tax=Penicillium verhagenii TaxID=1562060 RepID=UPI0025454CD1|nr:uncharacterized protein N7466_007892 [Penicillium verhagenii]KAJ5928936.1 hypothetical protein N7466_007892 [Penicillium verhagenii]
MDSITSHRLGALILASIPIFFGITSATSTSSEATTVASLSTTTGLPTTAAYFVDGTTARFSRTTLTATGTDEGVIIVKETGVAYVSDSTLIKTGNTTVEDDSSFTDLNAAVGVETNGTIFITNSKIITDGVGANGLHTYEDGSIAHLSNVEIHAKGDFSHGVYTGGGTIYGNDLMINTYDAHGSAIATDQGGGLIEVKNAVANTYGALSALVYSTGNITTSFLSGVSAIAPVACIDGSNSFSLNNPSVTSGTQNNGVFQVVSTVATNGTVDTAYAYVTGGSVVETNGTYGVLFVANIQANVYFTAVDIKAKSGILANITADDQFGTAGVNGGTVNLFLTDLSISGDIYVDDISEANVYLTRSHWNGAVNTLNTTGTVSVHVDAASTWNLTGDSHVGTIGMRDGSSVRRGQYDLTYNHKARG